VLAEGEWLVVVGYFDPLTAKQAKRLANLKNGRRVLVLVTHKDNALLPVEARAVLIAALRDVDRVAVAKGGSESELPVNAHVQTIADLDEDALRTREFVKFVLERQHTT